MTEQRNAAVHIGQLNLRIPGDSAENGHRVAEGIGQGLAERLPVGMQRRLGALSLRVKVPAGATETEISNALSEAIIRALRK